MGWRLALVRALLILFVPAVMIAHIVAGIVRAPWAAWVFVRADARDMWKGDV